jgi:hypothetical protein
MGSLTRELCCSINLVVWLVQAGSVICMYNIGFDGDRRMIEKGAGVADGVEFDQLHFCHLDEAEKVYQKQN